jgi:hypothetical protein
LDSAPVEKSGILDKPKIKRKIQMNKDLLLIYKFPPVPVPRIMVWFIKYFVNLADSGPKSTQYFIFFLKTSLNTFVFETNLIKKV